MLLVYEMDDRARVGQQNQHIAPAAVARFGLKQVELGMELLERWDDLTPAKRQALARRMLEQLGGHVEVDGSKKCVICLTPRKTYVTNERCRTSSFCKYWAMLSC